MFQFDEPYVRPSDPSQVRDDFYGLTRDLCLDPQELLDKVASFLDCDTLAEIMDDLAMGRI